MVDPDQDNTERSKPPRLLDSAQRKQAREDEDLLRRGIDPATRGPNLTAALARQLWRKFDIAKRDKNIEPPIRYFQSKVDATVRNLRNVPIACAKGCSHCCNTWVSVTAPEALMIAKIILEKDLQISEKIRLANEHTGQWRFDTRDEHPYPCPLLQQRMCSIYETRPMSCRLAASKDAQVCARSFTNLTKEEIPIPMLYLMSRANCAVAMAAALRKAELPYRSYEFNAALARAIETPDSERSWLSGTDIFAGVAAEEVNIFSEPRAELMYQYAFSRL